ncbi:CAAX farnesyltransferase (FTase) subunit beta [Xylographa opegraphella]|nr:CAAX farnesyltransferase (FTase) subunit beta [Xylographa opegraphella]
MRAGVHDMASGLAPLSVPPLFRSLPKIQDSLATETSISQEETVHVCLPYLTGTDDTQDLSKLGLPHLEREKHIKFLQASLEALPSNFVAYDASRPWIVYWALNGLTLLGSDISHVIDTFSASQNADGGFGGGFGQLSHCAASYAAILSLSMVGGREVLDLIDRRAL